MSMRVNEDGKFFGRVVAAFAGAIPVMLFAGIVWWADSRTTDDRTATAISRLDRDVAAIKEEANEARLSAAADRQKTAELAGDVRNVLRSTARIEALLDRMLIAPQKLHP